MSKADYAVKIKPILKQLNMTSNAIQASAVMSRDGHTLVSVLGADIDDARLGAMCATMLSLGERASMELKRGSLKLVLIQGEEGYVMLLRIGQKAVLAIVSQPNANLGMMLMEAKKAVNDIEALKLL